LTTLQSLGRGASALAVVGTAVAALAVAAPPALASSPSSMEFLGGGRGPTAEVAIQHAIWDAQTSASAYQLFTCTPVGEPSVFETVNDPNFGHVFRAMASVSCTP
jgi:hypothetical protein